MTRTKKTPLVLLAMAVGLMSAGCQMNLKHVGYAAPNKVWYHWADGNNQKHTLVVCDVQPDGSESNCKESEI